MHVSLPPSLTQPPLPVAGEGERAGGTVEAGDRPAARQGLAGPQREKKYNAGHESGWRGGNGKGRQRLYVGTRSKDRKPQ